MNIANRGNPPAFFRGFTLVEMIMVVSISGILFLGLSAIVDVPRQVVQAQQSEVSVSHTDRLFDRLNSDLRFAVGASVIGDHSLEILTNNGSAVKYTFHPDQGGSVLRKDASGDVATVFQKATKVKFAIKYEPAKKTKHQDQDIESVQVVTASYKCKMSGKPKGMGKYAKKKKYAGKVGNQSLKTLTIGQVTRAGIYFRAKGIDDDDAMPDVLSACLRRNGFQDLTVRMFRCSGSKKPVAGSLVATAHVPNGALPLQFAAVDIPLSGAVKLKQGADYFLEFLSSGPGTSADIQYQSLDDGDDALVADSGFTSSTSGGATWESSSSCALKRASPFTVRVNKSKVGKQKWTSEDQKQKPKKMVPVCVRVHITLPSGNSEQELRAAFPMNNNLMQVTQ